MVVLPASTQSTETNVSNMRLLIVFHKMDLPEAHLVCGLHRAGVELQVTCEAKSDHQQLLRDAGVAITHLPLSSKFSLTAIFALRRMLRDFRPDIVHTVAARALSNTIFAVGGGGKRPRIVAYRGVLGNVSPWYPASWVSYLHPNVDAISCVSQAVNNYLHSVGIAESKLHTIYKGHDPSWYQDARTDLTRQALGIEYSETVIGCVANMRASKGMDILFEAIQLLPKQSAVRFLLIGDMQVPEKLREDARVMHLGFRSDAQALMKLFDVIVLASRREGLPKALLEAMLQGVVPIVTQAGGMPEVVRDGVDGIVVPIENPQRLADAMADIIKDNGKLSHYRASAKNRILDKFSIRDTVQQTLEMYSSLT